MLNLIVIFIINVDTTYTNMYLKTINEKCLKNIRVFIGGGIFKKIYVFDYTVYSNPFRKSKVQRATRPRKGTGLFALLSTGVTSILK